MKLDPAVSFGTWLRRCRMAQGLTHAVLSDRAHCSASALRKIERDERRPSHRLAERLAASLQIPVEERARFVEVARGERRVERLADVSTIAMSLLRGTPADGVNAGGSARAAAEPAALPYNLPARLTSFIGRESEMRELRRLLGATRLLTLTGPGGIGKTRLALQLGTELTREYPDGVCWIDLAALTDPALVAPAAASAIGLVERSGRSATELLVEHLRPRAPLLLLDNCEHVIDACAILAQQLLGAAPNLRIVATSRESLGVAGEVAWQVAPLRASDPRGPTPDPAALLQYEAVRLFVERTQLAQPAFRLTATNAPAVAGICRQLDGIPLALELAAARVKLMSVEQITERLADRFRLLTGGGRTTVARHRTMHATITWSYDQLTERERLLFQRLSVFAGGWSLEAAEAIGAGAGLEHHEVLDLLSQLIDKSLVIVEPAAGRQARYRLLATIRQYALERLEQSGDVAAPRDRHLDWFLSLAERGDVGLRGQDPRPWLERLELEHDNVRAALDWGLSNEPGIERAVRLAGALSLFWGQRGHLREGLQWLDAALAAGRDAAAEARALALHGAGSLAWRLGDNARAHKLLNESLTLRRAAAVPLDLTRTLSMLGITYSAQRGPGDLDRARACFAESLPLARTIGDLQMVSHNLNALGEIARLLGDLREARDCYTQALEASRGLGDPLAAVLLLNLGLVAFAQGDVQPARAYFEQSLGYYRTLGEPGSLAACLDGLAGVCAVSGDAMCAAQLLGAADALRRAIDEPVQPTDRADHDRFVSAARCGVDDATFGAAWASGARLTLEQAIGLALARPSVRPSERPGADAGAQP